MQVAERLRSFGVRTTLSLPEGDGNAAGAAREAGIPARRLAFRRTPNPRDPRRVAGWGLLLPRDVGRFVALYRKEKPDVVHVNGAAFVAPALAAKLARVPLVWHLNDTLFSPGVAPLFGGLVRALADRIVVAAEAVASHYGVTRSPYEVIYAPVDVQRFGHLAGEPARGCGEVRRIGLVANWNRLKGVEYFVRAAALVRQRLDDRLELHFAGEKLATQAEYCSEVDGLIRDLELEELVCHHGFVASVEPVLAELDVLVLSSISEASPMVVLEAMAAGVPVVATDVGGVRELLLGEPDRPAGIVVPPRDPERLAEAILELLEHPEEARRLGKNGRFATERNFSLESCARRHLKVYTGAVSRSAGAA